MDPRVTDEELFALKGKYTPLSRIMSFKGKTSGAGNCLLMLHDGGRVLLTGPGHESPPEITAAF